MPYSPEVNDYEPMCVPCHKVADLARLAKTAARRKTRRDSPKK